MDLFKLCNDTAIEGRTGRIWFPKSSYIKVCKELGIEFNQLSDLGKMVLKDNMIDALHYSQKISSNRNPFKDGKYYLNL